MLPLPVVPLPLTIVAVVAYARSQRVLMPWHWVYAVAFTECAVEIALCVYAVRYHMWFASYVARHLPWLAPYAFFMVSAGLALPVVGLLLPVCDPPRQPLAQRVEAACNAVRTPMLPPITVCGTQWSVWPAHSTASPFGSALASGSAASVNDGGGAASADTAATRFVESWPWDEVTAPSPRQPLSDDDAQTLLCVTDPPLLMSWCLFAGITTTVLYGVAATDTTTGADATRRSGGGAGVHGGGAGGGGGSDPFDTAATTTGAAAAAVASATPHSGAGTDWPSVCVWLAVGVAVACVVLYAAELIRRVWFVWCCRLLDAQHKAARSADADAPDSRAGRNAAAPDTADATDADADADVEVGGGDERRSLLG